MEGNVAPGLEEIRSNVEDAYGQGGEEQQHFGSPGGTQYHGGSPYEGSSADGDGSAGNLIVNYLPSSVTEEALRALFAPYGEVTSCKLMKDKHTGQSLGYGFIEYQDPQSAQRSIDGLNGKPLENKRLKVSYARPSSSDIQHANLYVSKLDPNVTKEQLDHVFAPYGTIIDSKILIDPMTGVNRGVGFVRFDTRAQAEAAIEALNGTQPEGMHQPLGVKFADTVEDKLKKKRKMVGGTPYGQAPGKAPAGPAYGAAYGAGYGAYGGYTGYGGARYSPYGPTSGQHYAGYGMGHEAYGYAPAADPYAYAAYGAAAPVYGAPAPPGYGAPAPAPMGGGVPPAGAAPAPGGGAGAPASGGGGPASTQQYCLFVYNLPPTSDDNYLYRLFSPYGALYNVRLVRDIATGQCKGYGFVNFMKMEDAQQAILALNGYQLLPNKALQVSFKTQKTVGAGGSGGGGGGGYGAPPSY